MKIGLIVVGLLLSLVGNTQNLSSYQWKNRLVILVDYSKNQQFSKQQVAILAKDKAGLKDRKLKILQFTKDQFKVGLAEKNNWQKGQLPNKIDRAIDQNALFQVFLIGLDGGIKMHRTEVVSLNDIFGLIDTMPMRQSELRGDK